MQENSLGEQLNEAKTAVWQYIRENLLMIDILKSKKQTHETIVKIFDIYEMSLNLAIQYRVNVPLIDVTSGYLDFLLKHRKYDRYVEVLEVVLGYMEGIAFDNPSYMERYIAFCNACGELYEGLSQCGDPEYEKLADVCFDEVAKANKNT